MSILAVAVGILMVSLIILIRKRSQDGKAKKTSNSEPTATLPSDYIELDNIQPSRSSNIFTYEYDVAATPSDKIAQYEAIESSGSSPPEHIYKGVDNYYNLP